MQWEQTNTEAQLTLVVLQALLEKQRSGVLSDAQVAALDAAISVFQASLDAI